MDDMDLIIEEQERLLRFRSIDLDKISRICLDAADTLKKMNAPCYIRAAVNKTVVFSMCLPGASMNNENWARRKANFCEQYWISSLHAMRNMQKNGLKKRKGTMNLNGHGARRPMTTRPTTVSTQATAVQMTTPPHATSPEAKVSANIS